jgi:phage-related protein
LQYLDGLYEMTDKVSTIHKESAPLGIKPVEWIKDSRSVLKRFPDEARNIAGNQIWLVQLGRESDDWYTMRQIGHGAFEIRIHRPHEHRVIYVAKFPEAI